MIKRRGSVRAVLSRVTLVRETPVIVGVMLLGFICWLLLGAWLLLGVLGGLGFGFGGGGECRERRREVIG